MDDRASPPRYFADYEVYDVGQCIAWGQATLASTPDHAVDALRRCAAEQQAVDAGAIRLRTICRL
ncbi:hypothetical protein SAMN05428990_0922 [Pseudoxanthomonas sp. YR558]|nr:hypothetical protein SAMN05428990_0922 [Pseudoxanthomonas sp. YR558]